MTITVQQFSSFDITAPETIEVVIPPVAVSSAQAVVAPSFVVLPIKGSATLSGRLIEQPAEGNPNPNPNPNPKPDPNPNPNPDPDPDPNPNQPRCAAARGSSSPSA